MHDEKPAGHPWVINSTLIGCFVFATVAWTSFIKEAAKEMKGRER